MEKTSYVIALGSNRRHRDHGAPAHVLAAVADVLSGAGIETLARAPIFHTAAVGPAGRRFANGALLVRTTLPPDALLGQLKATERAFGRRRGRRWGPRVLDLDIILWSEGRWHGAGLAIPHPGFRVRRFVLDPVATIAPDWRDPVSGRSIRQLRAHLVRRRATQ